LDVLLATFSSPRCALNPRCVLFLLLFFCIQVAVSKLEIGKEAGTHRISGLNRSCETIRPVPSPLENDPLPCAARNQNPNYSMSFGFWDSKAAAGDVERQIHVPKGAFQRRKAPLGCPAKLTLMWITRIRACKYVANTTAHHNTIKLYLKHPFKPQERNTKVLFLRIKRLPEPCSLCDDRVHI